MTPRSLAGPVPGVFASVCVVLVQLKSVLASCPIPFLRCRGVCSGSSYGGREEGAQLLPKNQAEGFGSSRKYERVDGECWKGTVEGGREEGEEFERDKRDGGGREMEDI